MQFFSSKKVKYGLAKYLSGFIITLLFFGGVSLANAYYDVVIAWDPNNDPDLAGYILYVDNGSTPMPYGYVATYQLDDLDPVNPSVKIIDLKDDLAYYFAVTAYDIDGNESDYSDEICVIDGEACPSSWLASRSSRSSNASVSGSGGGGGGASCFIDTSMNDRKSAVDLHALLWIFGTLGMLSLFIAHQHSKRNGFYLKKLFLRQD